MLLIGVDKHGHGSWYAIRDDAELGLGSKVFLDENKPEKKGAKTEGATKDIPGSIHLGRRTDYLITVLREEHQKPGILDLLSGKAKEAPVKEAKNRPRVGSSSKPSTSRKVTNGDAGPSSDKKKRPSDRVRESSPKPKKTTPAKVSGKSSKPSKNSTSKHAEEEPFSGYESMDEANLKEEMRPVRHNLKAIHAKPVTDDKEKLSEYGRALIINIKTVGDHIARDTRHLPSPSRDKKQKHLWCFVRNFWPSHISHKRLQAMYENVVANEKKKAAAAAAAANGTVN